VSIREHALFQCRAAIGSSPARSLKIVLWETPLTEFWRPTNRPTTLAASACGQRCSPAHIDGIRRFRVKTSSVDAWRSRPSRASRRVLEVVERTVGEGTVYEGEYRLVLPGGVMKVVHVVSHPVFSASGGVEKYVGTVLDVRTQTRG
jgi:hypothetical protein